MSWSITTLGDSVDFNPVVRLSTGQQYPFVPMEAIRPGERIVEANQTRMAGGGAKFQDGDVLFARITPCLENGKIAQFRTSNLRPAFGSTEFIVFRAKLDKLDQNFLYYLTLTQSVRAPAEKSMSGATGRQRADINAIRQIEIPLPLLATQRRIAQILSAYDDLIENNTRRIAILEEMARRLFEDWFIHFRYPGGEGPDAGLPEGWALRKIGDLLSFSGGGDWGSDAPTENENKEVRVIRGTDFDDGRVGRQMRAPVRFITARSLATRRVMTGDIIVENSINAKSRSSGKPLWISDGLLGHFDQAVIAASFCKLYRPIDMTLGPILYLHMKRQFENDEMPYFQNVAANGIANFQSQRYLSESSIALPSDENLLSRMSEVLRALIDTTLSDQIRCLRATRDLLLPKLISGEIDVSTAAAPELAPALDIAAE